MHTISARRRLLAALLLPFVLLLASCGRVNADFEIQNADRIDLALDFAISTEILDELSTYGQSYDSPEEFCQGTDEETEMFGEVEPKAYEEDGMWGCRGSGYIEREDFGDGLNLTEQDGEYHFEITGNTFGVTQEDLDMNPYGDIDFEITFTFPGKIIESKGGEIDGKTVTYTDIVEFDEGVDIRADASSFPWVIVVIAVLVIGFLLLVALAAVVFFVMRSRKNKAGSSGSFGPGSPVAPAEFGGAAGAPGAAGAAGAAGASGQPGGGQPGSGQPGGSPAPQWGQNSPPAAPPQGGQFSSQGGSSPAQPWSAPPQDSQQPPASQNGQGQSWAHPPQGSQSGQGGQPGQSGQGGQQPWNQQPPQNPGA